MVYAAEVTAPSAPGLAGLHHLTLPVMELEVSCAWYAQALGASRVARFDHHDSSGRLVAVVLEVPGLGTLLQLRCDVDPGLDVRGFPPITFQVDDPAHLRAWIGYFDAVGVEHSPVEQRNVGTSVSITSPDRTLLRFQTRPGPDAG